MSTIISYNEYKSRWFMCQEKEGQNSYLSYVLRVRVDKGKSCNFSRRRQRVTFISMQRCNTDSGHHTRGSRFRGDMPLYIGHSNNGM